MCQIKKLLIQMYIVVILMVFVRPVVADAATTLFQRESEISDGGTESTIPQTGDNPNMPTESPVQPQVSEEPVLSELVVADISVNIGRVKYKKKRMVLKWEKVDGASEYTVLQKTTNGWEDFLITAGSKATVSVKSYGKGCRYQVQAYGADGTLVGESEKIKVLIPSKAGPLKTTAVSTKKVKLTWAKSKGATAYQVYKKKGTGKYRLVGKKSGTKARLDTKKNETCRFKVVPIFQSDIGIIQGKADNIAFQNIEFVSLNHQKYSYQEMGADILSLCKKYNEYVSYGVIGYSERGRKIYDVILGNPKAKKTVLVVSTIHGREYIATAVCMKQLEYYLLHYNETVDGKKLSTVFKNCNIHYIMMANPDGVVISQTTNPQWKGNANGVNLNRNFPYAFHVEGSISDQSYSGKSAASERETRAIVSFTQKLNTTQKLAVVNYHAMGRIVFGDYGGKDSSLRADIRLMYSIARSTTGYADAGGYSSSSHGNYRNYLIYKLKVPSVTLEMGSVSCPVPQYQYASAFSQNRLVVLREAAWLAGKK